MDESRHRSLIGSLVGEHESLYHHSASFHYAIEAFAEMLPYMVNGLAEMAVKADAQLAAVKEEMMSELVMPMFHVDNLQWCVLCGQAKHPGKTCSEARAFQA